MSRFRLMSEPSLDDLLDDEMMRRVLKSAGTDEAGLRRLLELIRSNMAAGATHPRCREARCS